MLTLFTVFCGRQRSAKIGIQGNLSKKVSKECASECRIWHHIKNVKQLIVIKRFQTPHSTTSSYKYKGLVSGFYCLPRLQKENQRNFFIHFAQATKTITFDTLRKQWFKILSLSGTKFHFKLSLQMWYTMDDRYVLVSFLKAYIRSFFLTLTGLWCYTEICKPEKCRK